MNTSQLTAVLIDHRDEFFPIVPFNFNSQGMAIDLSVHNRAIEAIDLADTDAWQRYIWGEMQKRGAAVCAGGYFEERNRYMESELFLREGEPRTIHLGVDIWAEAGTPVHAPLESHVHSVRNNANFLDYGPTVILCHEIEGLTFHTLYGHLTIHSLEDKKPGDRIARGTPFAALGDASVNGSWPPHLHFQIILDMKGMEGDFPGVCARSQMEVYRANCPDPNLILGYKALVGSTG